MSQSLLLGGGGASLWVSGTTYTQGKQVVSPVDFNLYVRKTNGAGATDPSGDTTNWQPLPTGVKSIQRGTISLSGVSSATATISSVVVAKSQLNFLGCSTAQLTNDYLAHIVLTGSPSSTTITAIRVNNGASNTTVSYELVERY